MSRTRTTQEINDRLLAAIEIAGLTHEDLAHVSTIAVSPGTVRRWTDRNQTPNLDRQIAVATALNVDRSELWPASPHRLSATRPKDMVADYGTRSQVPPALWIEPLRRTVRRIDVRVHAGPEFFFGTPDLRAHLMARADEGVKVRLLLGDPDAESVACRGQELGIDGAAQVREVLQYLEPVMGYPGIEIRLDETSLFYSLYAFDNLMIVNSTLNGVPESMLWHLELRRTEPNGMFDFYLQNFELLWSLGAPNGSRRLERRGA